MKQNEFKRKTPFQRGPGPKRKQAPKRTQPRRDWTLAREKVDRETRCRFWRTGGCGGPLEAAHVIGREHDPFTAGFDRRFKQDRKVLVVCPVRIVPLCRDHHRAYDAHSLDLLGLLELAEQVQAVRDAGGLELARRRLAPSAYRPPENDLARRAA